VNAAAPNPLDAFIRTMKDRETFPVLLERLRTERGLSPPELYGGAWVDRRLYSKIMGERDYHPAKSTVLALGLSLRLPLDGMRGLLESAGFTLSRSIVADLVVRFCIENGLYDLREVNARLAGAGQRAIPGK